MRIQPKGMIPGKLPGKRSVRNMFPARLTFESKKKMYGISIKMRGISEKMQCILRAATIVAIAAILATQNIQSEETSDQAEFDLQVGDRTYEIRTGQPTKIVTPGGDTVEVVLSKKQILQYAGHGVSFEYHHQMKLSADSEADIVTITVESPETPLALIQVYPSQFIASEPLGALLAQAYWEEFQARNAELIYDTDEFTTRSIAGSDHRGGRLDFVLAGQRMKVEIFTFATEDAVIAMIFQHDIAETVLAERYFKIIADSFKTE